MSYKLEKNNWQAVKPIVESTIRAYMVCKDIVVDNKMIFSGDPKIYGLPFETGFKSLFKEFNAETSANEEKLMIEHKLEIYLLGAYKEATLQNIETYFFKELAYELYYCLNELNAEIAWLLYLLDSSGGFGPTPLPPAWRFKLSIYFEDTDEANVKSSVSYLLSQGALEFKKLAFQHQCLTIKLTCTIEERAGGLSTPAPTPPSRNYGGVELDIKWSKPGVIRHHWQKALELFHISTILIVSDPERGDLSLELTSYERVIFNALSSLTDHFSVTRELNPSEETISYTFVLTKPKVRDSYNDVREYLAELYSIVTEANARFSCGQYGQHSLWDFQFVVIRKTQPLDSEDEVRTEPVDLNEELARFILTLSNSDVIIHLIQVKQTRPAP